MTAVEAALPASNARRLLPWLVAVAFFMQALDTTILNTAVPAIARALGVAPLSMKAVLSSYTLSLAVFIPISGWMANRFGTRRVFAGAIGLFTAGSVLCGLSRDIHWLVAFRVLQGCGGAMMVPVGRLAVLHATRKEDLMRAITLITWPRLIAPVIGPPLGGFIATYSSWRWIFYLNVPLGFVGILLSLRFVRDTRKDTERTFDVLGFVLCGVTCATLLYATDLIGRSVERWREVLVFLVVSGAAVIGGLVHLRRARNPVVDLSTLRVKTFAVSLRSGSLLRMSNSCLLFLLPVMFQVGQANPGRNRHLRVVAEKTQVRPLVDVKRRIDR